MSGMCSVCGLRYVCGLCFVCRLCSTCARRLIRAHPEVDIHTAAFVATSENRLLDSEFDQWLIDIVGLCRTITAPDAFQTTASALEVD